MALGSFMLSEEWAESRFFIIIIIITTIIIIAARLKKG